ncbi:odorant receptor 59a [Eurosta solidaginis]|uniref:odorant receptor 59a n=1 Tax=Eurosta solidaginis TaxID=178769 RepID=UPI0035314175
MRRKDSSNLKKFKTTQLKRVKCVHNAMSLPIDSNAFFKIHWLGFRICGGLPPTDKQRIAYFIYAFVVGVLVNIFYPLHLALALFRNGTLGDIKTLTVFFTALTCTIKFFVYTQKLSLLYEIQEIYAELDVRVHSNVERKYFARMCMSVRNIAYGFLCVYALIAFSGELGFLFRQERSLLYPAWLPYDWRATRMNFVLTNVYQFFGTIYQITQNYIHDSLPPVAFCLLSGHIKLLGMRIRLIGFDCVNKDENEQELVRCIKDQKNLFKLFNLLEKLISWPMLIQLTVSAFNICITLVAILFYTDTLFERVYYVIYFSAMAFQIFPICYYGSNLQYLFGSLHYEIFCCNWTEQTPRFKKLMILFTERTLKDTTALAGGMVRIHLDTFFSTMRGAYSLFAVIMKMK